MAAALSLAAGGAWEGGGKALARALLAADPDLAERLVNGHRHVVVYGDTAVLHRAAVDVLVRAGVRCWWATGCPADPRRRNPPYAGRRPLPRPCGRSR